jgi:hypothetical protein
VKFGWQHDNIVFDHMLSLAVDCNMMGPTATACSMMDVAFSGSFDWEFVVQPLPFFMVLWEVYI